MHKRFEDEDMGCDIDPCDILGLYFGMPEEVIAENFGDEAPEEAKAPAVSMWVQVPADYHNPPDCCEVKLPPRAPRPGDVYILSSAVAFREAVYGQCCYEIRTPRGWSTFEIKDQLRAIGARWDKSRRRWWITWDRLYPYADMGMDERINEENRLGYGLMDGPRKSRRYD